VVDARRRSYDKEGRGVALLPKSAKNVSSKRGVAKLQPPPRTRKPEKLERVTVIRRGHAALGKAGLTTFVTECRREEKLFSGTLLSTGEKTRHDGAKEKPHQSLVTRELLRYRKKEGVVQKQKNRQVGQTSLPVKQTLRVAAEEKGYRYFWGGW